VPTPFYHLDLAEEMLAHGALAPEPKARLLSARPAFLFGNTAPDYVTLASLPRETAHFFNVPIRRAEPAHQRLLGQFPALRASSSLPDPQAAFIAGYLAHLWLDQAWIVTVFEPIFGPTVRRDSFQQRLLDHNLLRAHLDRSARSNLPDGLAEELTAAEPRDWLPFADDYDLAAWRDLLAQQLSPGGRSRTVDVFARRHGISSSSFTEMLNSGPMMMQAVFQHLSSHTLSHLQQEWLNRSVELLNDYLSEGRFAAKHVNLPLRKQLNPQPVRPGG
jgi:hypothetical protein